MMHDGAKFKERQIAPGCCLCTQITSASTRCVLYAEWHKIIPVIGLGLLWILILLCKRVQGAQLPHSFHIHVDRLAFLGAVLLLSLGGLGVCGLAGCLLPVSFLLGSGWLWLRASAAFSGDWRHDWVCCLSWIHKDVRKHVGAWMAEYYTCYIRLIYILHLFSLIALCYTESLRSDMISASFKSG